MRSIYRSLPALTFIAFINCEAQSQNLPLTNGANSRFEPLCQQLSEIRKSKQITTVGYCGVIIPENDSSIIQPVWADIDPKSNIEIVKTMYYWQGFWGGTQESQLYKDQLKNLGTMNPELMEAFWPKAEGQIMEFLENGEVTLQSTSFDIDGDDLNELVYRMTPIVRLGGAKSPWEQDPHKLIVDKRCKNSGLPGGDEIFFYYSPANGLPTPNFGALITPFHLSINGLLKWNGESLFVKDFSLLQGDTHERYDAAQICNF